MREFDDVEVEYSSIAYLADISRVTRYGESGDIAQPKTASLTDEWNSDDIIRRNWCFQCSICRQH